jgi:cytosine/adenosine deaminase-related metal-dependent hydrolase
VIEHSGPVRLLHNGTIVTGAGDPLVWTEGAVAWSESHIIAVGSEAELRSEYPEAELLDARGGLVLPGLINLHHHLYSALARGLAPAETPRDFGQILEHLWWLLDRALTPEAVRLSALLGAADCIRWGCTTLFDHHASPSCIRGSLDTIAEVIEEAGLSAVLCYEITDRNGHDQAVAGLVDTLGLHASFTVSDETLDEAASRRPDDIGCHIHLAEDPIDFQASEIAYGAPPLARLEQRGFLDERALLIHGVHLTSEGRKVITENDAVLVHCPESNANNGVGRLDVERAVAGGTTVGLGTDGMSSAMLRALRAAFLIQRAGREDPSVGFTAHPGLLYTNALVARRFLDEPHLGELVVGAPADICVVDSPPPTPIGPDNVFGHLVYGASEAPVRHTIARGRVLLEDFRHTTLDPITIAGDARREAFGMWERFRELANSSDSLLPL